MKEVKKLQISIILLLTKICSLAFYFSLNLKYGHAHWKRYPCAVREAR